MKREKDSTSFFEDLQFACLSQLQGVTMKAKDKDTFNNVKTYGGKVVTSLSKSVLSPLYPPSSPSPCSSLIPPRGLETNYWQSSYLFLFLPPLPSSLPSSPPLSSSPLLSSLFTYISLSLPLFFFFFLFFR